MSEKKTSLIAGGAGFIGFHLCKNLLSRGEKVICFDNLTTGSAENIRMFEKTDSFLFLKGDIRKKLELSEKIDFILNFACPASPKAYQKDPVGTAETNFIGTKNLLDLALEKKAVFFQASTSEIYGNPEKHPQKESYWGNVNPIGARSCYDEGKRIAETLCFDYQRTRGVKTKIARIFNTYGPHMRSDDGRAVSNFIVQALKNKPITVYGDGSQTRSFCYIDDLVRGIIKFLNSKENGPVNLGNPKEITVLKLAEKIIAATGSQSKIARLPLPEDDPARRRPDISKAKKTLNWKPEKSLDEGLNKTVSYFRSLTL